MERDETREPEIIARLNLLQEKLRSLREKLSPVMVELAKSVGEVPVKNSSQSLYLINQTINLVDDIKDSVDIN